MVRRIPEHLGRIETLIWAWGVLAALTIGVVVWAVHTRLPGVIVFVLALGTAILMVIGLETALVVGEKLKEIRGWRYRRVIDELQRLRRQGVILRNRPVASDAEAKFFAADVETFEATALAAMPGGVVAPTDISWFRDFQLETAPPDPTAFNDEHARMKAILEEKLSRMREITERLEVKIHT